MNIFHSPVVVCTIFLSISMSASAAVETFASGRSVTHKSASGVSIVFPDICKTPGPTVGPIPIPYPNIAMSGDTKKGSKNTKVSRKIPVAAGSKLKISTGDEGSADSVLSSTNRDKSDVVLYSFDVKLGGQLHIRQFARTRRNTSDSNLPATTVKIVPRSTSASEDAKSSVTEATYVDVSGKEIRLQEPTLIELTNGEFCAVCVANGKVTAIHRLLAETPKRKQRQAPRQNNR